MWFKNRMTSAQKKNETFVDFTFSRKALKVYSSMFHDFI